MKMWKEYLFTKTIDELKEMYSAYSMSNPRSSFAIQEEDKQRASAIKKHLKKEFGIEIL